MVVNKKLICGFLPIYRNKTVNWFNSGCVWCRAFKQVGVPNKLVGVHPSKTQKKKIELHWTIGAAGR